MKAFEAGDRIIYAGEYVGTLTGEPVNQALGRAWAVEWDDKADTKGCHFAESKMVYANGGPTSATRTVPAEPMGEELDTITGAARSWLYELESEIIPGSGSQEDRDGFEEQAAKLRAALVKIGVEI